MSAKFTNFAPMIKAIFFDIDGTLVSFNTHEIPPSAKQALQKLRDMGVRLFIASGRHICAINNLGDEQFDGFVTVNGAMTIVDNKVIDRNCIPKEDYKRINQYMAAKHNFPCAVVLDDHIELNYYNDSVEQILALINFPRLPTADLTTFEDKNVYQLIAFFTADDEKAIMQNAPNCVTTRWHPLFTDVIRRGTSKVSGLEKICEHFGIKREETMAFGDGGNDIEMLQWAGIGVAMGNADNEVKAAANYVTSSVDNDGLAKAINHFIDKICSKK